MATIESNAANIEINRLAIAELISKSVLPSVMTATQRKLVQDALFPVINGMNTDKIPNGNYSAHEVGDIAWKVDNTNKRYIYGRVLNAAFSGSDADINNPAYFDKYADDKPSF